ncbi:VOC family protein [Dyadobacter frigoris]|uniref:VOC family protein n=1 Tax=Dyadobacter frigoris TaxID=2576211 RepID=A0A4U6D0R3_9BACT|nr:VOC family protein [Dyadobacter frigoris]TKT90790.1 VOC family protein [Dyadobacter frigoris]GLU52125.1 glyoxalase [Dyadobacter frigoris]
MFRDTKAFSGFSVDNLENAKEFYSDILKLGITEMSEMRILQLHIWGGHDIVVYEKPNHEPATFTILNFPVQDVTKAVEELKALGIRFESYDLPGFKTDPDNVFRGGGPEIAWFKDPAGNILSVIAETM